MKINILLGNASLWCVAMAVVGCKYDGFLFPFISYILEYNYNYEFFISSIFLNAKYCGRFNTKLGEKYTKNKQFAEHLLD